MNISNTLILWYCEKFLSKKQKAILHTLSKMINSFCSPTLFYKCMSNIYPGIVFHLANDIRWYWPYTFKKCLFQFIHTKKHIYIIIKKHYKCIAYIRIVLFFLQFQWEEIMRLFKQGDYKKDGKQRSKSFHNYQPQKTMPR